MKIVPLLLAPTAALLLFGCAETQQSTDNHPSSAISVPLQTANPENPPPTLSGYVDTSYTAQVR